MEIRMNYFYCVLVLLACVCFWQPSNAMIVNLQYVECNSPRSPVSDSQRGNELLSPRVPPPPQNTPNVSPRDDLKEEKKPSDHMSVVGVESKKSIVAACVREKLQRHWVVMKYGILVAPELTTRDEELYPLHWAVRRNNPVKLKELLRSGVYDVNERDSWGATPLYWAAMGAGAGHGGADIDGFDREVGDDDDQESDNEMQKKAAEKIAKREARNVQKNIACFDLLLNAGANTNLCTEPLTMDCRLEHHEEVAGDEPDRSWAERAGLCKTGGDSVAHVLFALYNVDEVRLSTWLGYIVRLIQHDTDFKIKNNAGLAPIDLVDRKLRTRVNEIVEEKQAAFKQEKVEEVTRYQNAYLRCLMLDRVWDQLVATEHVQQEGDAVSDKLDRALHVLAAEEVVA